MDDFAHDEIEAALRGWEVRDNDGEPPCSIQRNVAGSLQTMVTGLTQDQADCIEGFIEHLRSASAGVGQARVGRLEEALRAYHDLAPALALCVNECGEALLYTTLHQANVRAEAALNGDPDG